MSQLKVRGKSIDDVAKAQAPAQIRSLLREMAEKIHRSGMLRTEVVQLNRWLAENESDHPRYSERSQRCYEKSLERGEFLGDVARLSADLDRTVDAVVKIPFSFYTEIVGWELQFGEEETCPF